MVYRRAALLCLLCLGILLIAWWVSARPPEPPSAAEAGHSSKPVVATEQRDGEVQIEGDLMLGSGEPKVLEPGTRTISSAGSSLEFEIRAVNATAKTIEVETTISSCGCTNAQTNDRTIVPGGATLVSGTIELRRPGPLYVSITLLDPDGGVVGRLVARAEVRSLDASVAVDGRWTSAPDGFEFRLGSVSELRVGPKSEADGLIGRSRDEAVSAAIRRVEGDTPSGPSASLDASRVLRQNLVLQRYPALLRLSKRPSGSVAA